MDDYSIYIYSWFLIEWFRLISCLITYNFIYIVSSFKAKFWLPNWGQNDRSFWTMHDPRSTRNYRLWSSFSWGRICLKFAAPLGAFRWVPRSTGAFFIVIIVIVSLVISFKFSQGFTAWFSFRGGNKRQNTYIYVYIYIEYMYISICIAFCGGHSTCSRLAIHQSHSRRPSESLAVQISWPCRMRESLPQHPGKDQPVMLSWSLRCHGVTETTRSFCT